MQDRELTTFAYRFSYRRVEASNIEVTSNLIPLLSQPTRVGMPNFLYIRNRRDNDLESTRGSYTTRRRRRCRQLFWIRGRLQPAAG